jgi:LytS/YehU family sensor histidine kinase
MEKVLNNFRFSKLSEEMRIGIGVLIALSVIFNVVKGLAFPEQSLKWHLFTSFVGLIMMIAVGFIAWWIDVTLDKKYPFERNPVKRLVMQFFITLFAIVVVRLASIPLFITHMVVRPTKELIIAGFAINLFMVLSFVLSIFGYHFFKRWKEGQLIAAELAKDKAIVQYDNLKNQLNPHFLFNALSSLNSLIFENPQLASDFLLQLSKVYRYVLDNKEKNSVPLREEINFVKHYVTLLETRFGEGIVVQFRVKEEDEVKKIMPVTLQILLENAVKHNITSKETPLVIQVSTDGYFLVVENNLQKKNAIEISNKQGLENLKSLYRYISDREVFVTETDNSFAVKIPLI